MSTETIERDIISIDEAPSVEVGGDLDSAVHDEHALALVESEGMHGTPLPVPGEVEEEHDREREGLRRIFEARRATNEVFLEFSVADRKAKGLKKKWEASVEDLDAIIADVESGQQPLPLESGGFLHDPRKVSLNAIFAKPDSVAPLPADTFAEHLRRLQQNISVESMGLKPSTAAKLDDLGLTTALKVVAKWTAVFEGGAEPTSIPGITEKREAEIAEALDRLTTTAQEEWSKLHPDEAIPMGLDSGDDEEGGDDE